MNIIHITEYFFLRFNSLKITHLNRKVYQTPTRANIFWDELRASPLNIFYIMNFISFTCLKQLRTHSSHICFTSSICLFFYICEFIFRYISLRYYVMMYVVFSISDLFFHYFILHNISPFHQKQHGYPTPSRFRLSKVIEKSVWQ